MTEFIQIQSTFPSREDAIRVAQSLVSQKLAACVQVGGPIVSVYCWKGDLETSDEWTCTIKTRSAWFSRVESAIRGLHSYEVPELIATPLSQISADYAEWLNTELPLAASR